MTVWIVARFEFEQGDSRSIGRRRRAEVMRLPGDTPRAKVARVMEREYAKTYQPGWSETSPVDEKAWWFPAEREIWVGHEPRFRGRLVEIASRKSQGQAKE